MSRRHRHQAWIRHFVTSGAEVNRTQIAIAVFLLACTVGWLAWSSLRRQDEAPSPVTPNVVYLVTAGKPFNVPSDPRARYFVTSIGDDDGDKLIVTKRVSATDTERARRLYNCPNNTVLDLDPGATPTGLELLHLESRMQPIATGSIDYYVGIQACN